MENMNPTRTNSPRRRTIRRRTVQIATAVALLAMVGGFALATFAIGNLTGPETGQSGASLSTTGTPGVQTTSVYLAQQAHGPGSKGYGASHSSGTGLTQLSAFDVCGIATNCVAAGTELYNVTAITAVGDITQNISVKWTFPTATAGNEWSLSIDIGGVTATPAVLYACTPTGTLAGDSTVTFAYDLSGSANTVDTVSVIATNLGALGGSNDATCS